MGLSCGIVGLPNVGKSTLFNAITAAGIAAENYPFCTIEPNTGVVAVPDKRLDALAEIYKPKRILPTTIDFVDIAGLVKGAAQGEGLGNQFLSHIRQVDAVVHVVRAFQNDNVIHVNGRIDPKSDIEIIEAELIFKDIETAEKRIENTSKKLKSGDKKAAEEVEMLKTLLAHFGEGKPARTFAKTLSEAARAILGELYLLTNKPVLYAANTDETGLMKGNDFIKKIEEIAAEEEALVVPICAKVEEELSQLPMAEREAFLAELGLPESGLSRLVRAAYKLLGLLTYFTCGEQEVRAWTVHRGARAPQAAGVIHTDFEKGFIKAETISYNDIIRLRSEPAVKEAGLLRIEGKDYVVKDGDVMHFRFNV